MGPRPRGSPKSPALRRSKDGAPVFAETVGALPGNAPIQPTGTGLSRSPQRGRRERGGRRGEPAITGAAEGENKNPPTLRSGDFPAYGLMIKRPPEGSRNWHRIFIIAQMFAIVKGKFPNQPTGTGLSRSPQRGRRERGGRRGEPAITGAAGTEHRSSRGGAAEGAPPGGVAKVGKPPPLGGERAAGAGACRGYGGAAAPCKRSEQQREPDRASAAASEAKQAQRRGFGAVAPGAERGSAANAAERRGLGRQPLYLIFGHY